MATFRGDRVFRRIFPTARQLLLVSDRNYFCPAYANKVLVIGAGFDPYRGRFESADLYVGVDLVNHSGANDVVADALSMPFVEGSFDCVVATEVAEHVRDPIQLFMEVHRVLAPKGKLLLSVPFGFHQHADPVDYNRPIFWSLKEGMASFSSVQILPQGNCVHVLSDLITTAFSPLGC